MKSGIKGVGVALVTPFKDCGSVDFDALGSLINHVITGGVDYLVVLGTTAETPTLTALEKDDVVKSVIAHNAGRLPLVVGIGGNNTADVVSSVTNFDFTGVDYLLSVTPYYNKPSQEGIYQHYQAVAEASARPVILYNVPGRTGVNMSAETTLRLAHNVANLAGVKEASGNLSQIAYILRDRPTGFSVISGDDNLALMVSVLGGDGIISVAANAFPNDFTRMVHFASAGKTSEAASIHLRIMEAVDALFAEGNPTGVKSALAHYGLIKNNLRLPLVASSFALDDKIRTLIQKGDIK